MADNGNYCVTYTLYCIEIARRACVGDMSGSEREITKTAYDLESRPGVAEFVVDRFVDTHLRHNSKYTSVQYLAVDHFWGGLHVWGSKPASNASELGSLSEKLTSKREISWSLGRSTEPDRLRLAPLPFSRRHRRETTCWHRAL